MPEGKFFLIKSAMNGKSLDVRGSSSDPDTEVVMYDVHGGDNQLWYVDHIKGVIRSKLNDMCLELNASNRLVINEYNEEAPFNQLWTLGEQTVHHRHFRNRVFDIVGASDDNSAEVCTWEWHGQDNQLWEFEYQEPAYFMIQSEMNGKVLDVQGGEMCEGTRVITWEAHGGDNQLWYEDKNGVVRTKEGDFALDLFKDPGKAVRLGAFKVGLTQQMWGFSEETLVNFARRNICLDIKGCEDCDGAKVIAWDYHGNDNQRWHLEYVD